MKLLHSIYLNCAKLTGPNTDKSFVDVNVFAGCALLTKPPHNSVKPQSSCEKGVCISTCLRGRSMNSSVLETSTKCCRTYLWADFKRSLQECVSAKPRIPRQLDGSSWLSKNLQQASRTPFSCKRLAAGSRVCRGKKINKNKSHYSNDLIRLRDVSSLFYPGLNYYILSSPPISLLTHNSKICMANF